MRRAKRGRNPRARRPSRRTRKSLALVFALVFAAAAPRARAACVEFGPATAVAVLSLAGELAAVDVDGDGDLDALAVGPARVYWLENEDGGTTFTRHTVKSGAISFKSAAAADVDGDGDVDVVTGESFTDTVAWHARDDFDNWAQSVISSTVDGVRSVVVADLDRDGDPDVVAAAFNPGAVVWFANDGSGTSWTADTISVVTGSGTFKLFPADLDADGDLDVLAGSWDNRVTWYENSGSASGWTEHEVTSTLNQVESVTVADLDGDGDLDVAAAGFQENAVVAYENDGSGTSWTALTVSSAVSQPYSVATTDVDGDGDADLLVTSSYDDRVAWFENDGGGGGWRQHTVALGIDLAADVLGADFDSDGDADLLSSGSYSNQVFLHRNDRLHGEALFAARQTIEAITPTPRASVVGDVDGDGDLDVAAAWDNGEAVAWHENLDPGDGSAWTIHTVSTPLGATRIAVADLDRDGDLDALSAAGGSDAVAWHENLDPGDGSSWTDHAIVTTQDPYSVLAADLDGDGDLDIVLGSYGADEVVWYENLFPGDASSLTVHAISSDSTGAPSLAAVDVDRDGDLDLVAGFGGDDAVGWLENADPGDASAWTLHSISTADPFAYSIAVADIDGDGDADVLVGSYSGDRVVWHENLDPGDGSTWTRHVVATVDGVDSVALADVDRDGDLDALAAAAGATGHFSWFESDGTPVDGGWVVHTLLTGVAGANWVATGDLDGDGDADVVTSSTTEGDLHWLRNLGTHVHDDGFDSDGATTACWSTSNPPVP